MIDYKDSIDNPEVMEAILGRIRNRSRQEWIDLFLSYGMTMEEIVGTDMPPTPQRKYSRLSRPIRIPLTAKKPSHARSSHHRALVSSETQRKS